MFRQDENSKNSADDIQMISNEGFTSEITGNVPIDCGKNTSLVHLEDPSNTITNEEDSLI
jgi:hypothetical protein